MLWQRGYMDREFSSAAHSSPNLTGCSLTLNNAVSLCGKEEIMDGHPDVASIVG